MLVGAIDSSYRFVRNGEDMRRPSQDGTLAIVAHGIRALWGANMIISTNPAARCSQSEPRAPSTN